MAAVDLVSVLYHLSLCVCVPVCIWMRLYGAEEEGVEFNRQSEAGSFLFAVAMCS